MLLIVQRELTDRYIKQEVIGRIILLTRGVAVRTDSIMMIDIYVLNSWMGIFLRLMQQDIGLTCAIFILPASIFLFTPHVANHFKGMK